MASQRKAKTATQAPVSAHPLFPVIVALWFAALLGMGTMILPQALFDQLGVITGLGSLGFTFRLGLGLAAGLVGALIGIILARKVASGQSTIKPRKRGRVVDSGRSSARKPISAMEELGSDGLDDPIIETDHDYERQVVGEPLAGRRRPLTVTDESAPSEYLMSAPLPGGEGVLDLIGAEDIPEDHAAENALELGYFDQEEHDPVPDYSRPPEPARPGSPLFGVDPFAEPESNELAPAPVAPAPSAGDGVFRAPQPAVDTSGSFKGGAPFAAPNRPAGMANPFAPSATAEQPANSWPQFAKEAPVEHATEQVTAPFSAPAQPASPPSRSGFGGPAFSMPVPAEPAPFVSANPHVAAAPAFAPAPAPQQAFVQPEAASALGSEDLAGLDTVALVERFARALREAGGTAAASTATAATPGSPFAMPQPAAATPAPFAATPPVPVAAEPAAPFGAPAMPAAATAPAHPAAMPLAEPAPFGAPSLPAALAPLSFDEHDDGDEHDHGFSLPINYAAKPFTGPEEPAIPQPFAMPEPSVAAESEGEPENEDHFGSLLAMKSGFGAPREFVQIEEDDEADGSIEPVVVFPGTAPQGGAMPAPDGPSRDPAQSAPFARPPFAAQPAAQPVDRNATEAALRDALARLQQMSGAA